jgi:hypothetical protein
MREMKPDKKANRSGWGKLPRWRNGVGGRSAGFQTGFGFANGMNREPETQ